MQKKILIATDGSDTSMQAADTAISIGKNAGAVVTAVYVVDVHRLAQLPGYAAMPGIKDNLMELMFKEGCEALEEIGDKARDAGVAYERTIAQGDPGEELLKLCRDKEFDLIVLGTIGKSGLTKFLLGSVAEKVVRHAHIPVLVVPASAEGDI
ncbi:MAG: universal stress protein [Methanothrix sp.]|nr:universal stress protein [Methanothrix sp.]